MMAVVDVIPVHGPGQDKPNNRGGETDYDGPKVQWAEQGTNILVHNTILQ